MESRSAAAGVETVLWFSSYDSVDGPMGLRSNDGKKRKSFGAFRTMTRELGAFTLGKHLIGGDHRGSGVQVYQFNHPSGGKHVLWDIDGTETFVVSAKSLRSQSVRITGVQGRPVPLETTKDGIRLNLSQAPIYVTGLPDGFSLEPASPAVPTAPTFLFPQEIR